MDYKFFAYIIYLIVGFGATYGVARILYNNASVFLNTIFHDNEDLVDSVRALLKTGFYLLNVGLILAWMDGFSYKDSLSDMMEVLTNKIGGIFFWLGMIHMINVFIFFNLRKRALNNHSNDFKKSPEAHSIWHENNRAKVELPST